MIVGLNFSKNELIHVRFTSELKNFVAYCVFLAKHGFIWCCMTSIWPIIPALFLVPLASYYSQNYAGILASPLCVFICVCPRPRLLIISGMIWHDMNLIRMVKQVLQLLYDNFSCYH